MSTAGLSLPPSDSGAARRRRSSDTETDNRPTILFVDDDINVLNGLRAVLRRRIRGCTLLFAPGPLEALEMLDHQPVDLVVSDIQMPTIDGVELLEAIRLRHPETLRYVLSGEANLTNLTESVPVAHRWLSKPCDSDELAGSLSRALVHRRIDLADDPEARRALAASDPLPSPPNLYASLRSLLADDDAPIDDVAALVAKDPAVTAKLFQWANSASLGRTPVRDVKSAIGRVGLETVARLALSVEVVRMLSVGERIPGFDPDQFTAHCTAMSELAGRLAHPDEAVDAALAALLSTVGLLLEVSQMPERLEAAYRQAVEEDRTLVEVERERHGVGHPDLGVHLLSVWGLPADLVPLVGLAYEPPRLDRPPPLAAVDAVRAARLLTLHHPDRPPIGAPHCDRLDLEVLDVLAEWERALPPQQGDSV